MAIHPLTKEEAWEVARAASFKVESPDDSSRSRAILHCFMDNIGADWDLEDVKILISQSSERCWLSHIFGHDLTIVVDGKVYSFDVKRPENLLDPIS